jgi:hypothetical protein
MIRGDRPSGYFETTDSLGNRIQGETRQCVHCQHTWQYVPGSGKRRGICLWCKGLICGRAECISEQQRKVAGTQYHCMPFLEEQERTKDRIYKSVPAAIFGGTDGNKISIPEGMILSPSGIVIPHP